MCEREGQKVIPVADQQLDGRPPGASAGLFGAPDKSLTQGGRSGARPRGTEATGGKWEKGKRSHYSWAAEAPGTTGWQEGGCITVFLCCSLGEVCSLDLIVLERAEPGNEWAFAKNIAEQGASFPLNRGGGAKRGGAERSKGIREDLL